MIGLSKSKMKIIGKHIAFLEIEHQLTVPFSFESQQTSNITDATKEEVNQKRNAIEKAIVDQFSLDKKIHLDYNSVVIGYWKDYVEIELESCPLSKNQGPLIPGLEESIKYGNVASGRQVKNQTIKYFQIISLNHSTMAGK